MPPGTRRPPLARPPLELVPAPATDRAIADLAQMVVDVLAGQRTPEQLLPHVTTEVLAQLRRAVGARRATAGPTAAGPEPQGPRPGRQRESPRERQMVASTHIQRPAPDVVEAAVVLRGARRSGAMAIRLEWREARWRCTAIDAKT